MAFSLGCHWALLDFFFFFCSAWLTDQCAGIDNKGHLLKPTDSKILFLYNNSNHRTKGEDGKSNDTPRTKDKSCKDHRQSQGHGPFHSGSYASAMQKPFKRKSAILTPTEGNKQHSTGMITTDVRKQTKTFKKSAEAGVNVTDDNTIEANGGGVLY